MCCPDWKNLAIISSLLLILSLSGQGERVSYEKRRMSVALDSQSRECNTGTIGDRQVIFVRHQRVNASSIKSHGVLDLQDASHTDAELVGRLTAAYVGMRALKRKSTQQRAPLFFFLRKPQHQGFDEWQISQTAYALADGYNSTVNSTNQAVWGAEPGMKRLMPSNTLYRERELSTKELDEKLLPLVAPKPAQPDNEVTLGTGDVVVVVSLEYMAYFLTKHVFAEDDPQLMAFGYSLFKKKPKYTLVDVANRVRLAMRGPESWGEQMYNNAFVLKCEGGHWVISFLPYYRMKHWFQS